MDDFKVYDEYLAKDMVLTATSADGNGSKGRFKGTRASIEIKVVAKTAISVASTKVLTVKLQECDTESGTYADIATIYTGTAPTFAIGDVLGSLVLPIATKEYVKAVVTSTDSAAVGTIDIYPTYVAR
jgi:hypothetical protein